MADFTTLLDPELMEMEGIAPALVLFEIAAFKGFSVKGGAVILATGLYQAEKKSKINRVWRLDNESFCNRC